MILEVSTEVVTDFGLAVYEQCPECVVFVAQKQPSVEAIVPNLDDFQIDAPEVLTKLGFTS